MKFEMPKYKAPDFNTDFFIRTGGYNEKIRSSHCTF